MKSFAFGFAIACTSFLCTAAPQDVPNYDALTLIIPRVDTPQQVGMFQDGVMQQNQSGVWSITSLKTLGQGTVYNVGGITGVELIKVNSTPISFYLRVNGSDGQCDHTSAERIHQRRTENQIEVNISAAHLKPYSSSVLCPFVARSYKITVPLEVYGLPAGVYTYRVNGTFSGTFSIDRDNKFADDCAIDKLC